MPNSQPTMEPQLPPLTDPNKKTLVLDLDETLIHSSFLKTDKANFIIPVNFMGTLDTNRERNI